MAKSAFRLQLEDAIKQRHSAVHPWSEAWFSGKLNKHLLGEWVKQHYHFVMPTSRMFAAIYGNCEVQEVCDFLLENVTEEEGIVGQAGFDAVRHSELLLDFAEHCGKTRQEIIDAQENGELLPETLGLQSWCWRQSRRPFVEAIAAINVGLESQVPVVYAKTTPPLIEKYGFTEEEVTFFRLHIVADQEHGERAFNIVEKFAVSDEQKRTCVRLVKEATMMRRLYLDGLYNKYLLNPALKAA
jgi:pyrroloquinoline-quinone synthase